ncbi:acyl-ACP thioesterase domain-containing protein [Candidatus Ruminimicrobiellum ovillum]|uniref:acyl-ACP thioesterase domain-containing protein n=1 Tax=Candidatus Ruminimicrobiellum ovillum TaxID=1947927 RepID=UPI0035599FA6
MQKYSHTYNVILDNMDLFNYKLRPISAIMYLQDAFARYTATKKMAAYDLFATNQYWIITEINMEFTDVLPYWSEEIKAEIWISELSKLKVYTDFKIYYKDKVFANGNILWFIIDKDSKRPAKTDVVAERFELCDELVLGQHTKFVLPEIKEKFNELTHKINLSDLDFNKHVNNKSYINLAEMTAPDEFKKTHTVKNLKVKFNRESFLNDVLTCTTYTTNTENLYVHKIEKDGISVCDISTLWEEKTDTSTIVDYPLKIKG